MQAACQYDYYVQSNAKLNENLKYVKMFVIFGGWLLNDSLEQASNSRGISDSLENDQIHYSNGLLTASKLMPINVI